MNGYVYPTNARRRIASGPTVQTPSPKVIRLVTHLMEATAPCPPCQSSPLGFPRSRQSLRSDLAKREKRGSGAGHLGGALIRCLPQLIGHRPRIPSKTEHLLLLLDRDTSNIEALIPFLPKTAQNPHKSFAVCGHRISTNIAIVFSLLSNT